VIDAELDREDYDSIPTTAIGRGWEPLDVKVDPRTRLDIGGENKNKLFIYLNYIIRICEKTETKI
jgi:hypothetical protein